MPPHTYSVTHSVPRCLLPPYYCVKHKAHHELRSRAGTRRQLHEVNKHCSRVAWQGSRPKTWGAFSSLLSSKHFLNEAHSSPQFIFAGFFCHSHRENLMNAYIIWYRKTALYLHLTHLEQCECFSPKTVSFRQNVNTNPIQRLDEFRAEVSKKGWSPLASDQTAARFICGMTGNKPNTWF